MEQDKPYRFSKFCKVFKREEVYALYHAINMEVIYFPIHFQEVLDGFVMGSTLNRCLNRVQEGVTVSFQEIVRLFEILLEKKMLVPVETNEMETIKEIQERLGKPEIEVMYLVLTDNCNMRCDYCFLERETPHLFQPSNMSIETAKRAIDLFARVLSKSGKDKWIQLYGGEPLLNLKTLRFIIEYIHELKRHGKLPPLVSIAMVTNGTFLNEEIAFFLKEHDVSVGVSIDGDRNVMDAHRKYKSGRSPYDLIIKNYWLLKKLGVKTGVSATLTPRSLDEFESTLEFLTTLDLESSGLSFNILLCNAGIPVTEEYVQKASECIFRAFERFRELGIYEETMMRKVKSFINKEVALVNCAAYGNQLVVYPQGEIGVCQDDVKTKNYIAGSIYDKSFSPLESELIKEWSRRSPFNMPQCFECEAIGICGGGCATNASVEYGSIWCVDRRFCSHAKASLEWLIWDQYSQIQRS